MLSRQRQGTIPEKIALRGEIKLDHLTMKGVRRSQVREIGDGHKVGGQSWKRTVTRFFRTGSRE
jgi:hypothetical protein